MSKSTRRPRKRASSPSLSTELTVAIAAALDKKAMDLVILDLRNGLAFTDFFVICTGTTGRQVQAIAQAVQEALAKKGTRPAFVEGTNRNEWVLLDYFDFIVHIFTPSKREFYGLERLWGDAERIEVPA